MNGEFDRFPELYNLWLTVKEFPCQNYVFRNARLQLHRPDTDEGACDYDFSALIRGYDAADSWMDYPRKFIMHDLFTCTEKNAIEAYLAHHQFPGITLYKSRQTFPIPNHWAPCNVGVYGIWDGEYLFDEEEGFDCPVKFWGHYWLGETSIIAGLAQVTCESDGAVIINGLEGPASLLARQADILCRAILKAKAIGKPEHLTLRYELPLDRVLTPPIPRAPAYDRAS